MPEIRPFRGVCYNLEKVGSIGKVVTEPYDVISPQQQEAYYQLHPNNVIQLILGKRFPGDTDRDNQYTRARKIFKDWQKEKVLLRDQAESIYIYTQTYTSALGQKTRTGFVALMKLEDFAKNAVLPHENTFAHPVQDRSTLLKTVRANLSPIFALFGDPKLAITTLLKRYTKAEAPIFCFEKDGVTHRLWRLSDKKSIAAIKRALKDKQIFIADGHHRYEAALSNKKDYNYVMTYFTATTDPGLTILPTHRVVKINEQQKIPTLIKHLQKNFTFRHFSAAEELLSFLEQAPQRQSVFGVYAKGEGFFSLMLTKNPPAKKLAQKNHFVRDNLDAAILHREILGKNSGLTLAEDDILYTRDSKEAVQLVQSNKYQLAFFLRPPTIEQVTKVARAGERMPHKTTYFYPKVFSGLVINPLE
ncbi:MAG: DUF1015 domain-containing protein [Candidatus Omnitrophota bacterium]